MLQVYSPQQREQDQIYQTAIRQAQRVQADLRKLERASTSPELEQAKRELEAIGPISDPRD